MVQKQRDYETVRDEYDIAMLDPKQAHSKFVARVNEFKQGAKALEERVTVQKEDLERMKRQLSDLNSTNEVCYFVYCVRGVFAYDIQHPLYPYSSPYPSFTLSCYSPI